MLEEKYLYDWAGTEAYWMEENSSVSDNMSNVPEPPNWHDDGRVLVDGPPAVEPVVISATPEQPTHVPLPSRSEMHRNWLHVGAVGVSILTALGSVGVFSGKGGEKKPNIAKTQQSVNPTAPTNIALATEHGILPSAEPLANISPSPNFLDYCRNFQYDDSTRCVRATLKAIDNARSQEGLPAMRLPSGWYALTPAEQLFSVTDLERSVRGLRPFTAMNTALDQAAAQGADEAIDPLPPSGFPLSQWASNWAGAVGNPLEAIYYWMYDDGPDSGNIDCTVADTSGCWGHRRNVLMHLSCQMCLMGAAIAPAAYKGNPSLTEILVDSPGQ